MVLVQRFIEDGGRGKRIDSATRLGLDYHFRSPRPADLHQTLTGRCIMYLILALKLTIQPLTETSAFDPINT
jgi:hypothetical protein